MLVHSALSWADIVSAARATRDRASGVSTANPVAFAARIAPLSTVGIHKTGSVAICAWRRGAKNTFRSVEHRGQKRWGAQPGR